MLIDAELPYRAAGGPLKALEPENEPGIIFGELTTMLKNAIDRAGREKSGLWWEG